MAGSTRIRGNALALLVDGINYWADATSVILDGENMTVPATLCGPPQSVRLYSWFDIEAIQSTDEDSLWTFLLERQGEEFPFVYAPHGNETPETGKPVWTGTLATPDAPPTLGGQASRSRHHAQVFTTRLYIINGPHRA